MNARDGDLVVCVSTAPRPTHRQRHIDALRQLRLGRVYRVVGGAASRGIVLAGVRAADEPTMGWDPERFRKLNDGDEIPGMVERIKKCGKVSA